MNHDYKTNEGRNFQFTKFSFIDFVLNDRRSLSGKRPKSSSDKSSSCRFSFSAERNANTKATEDVTSSFLLVYWFSYPCRKVWTSLFVSNTFSVLDAMIWESSDKQLLLRIVRALPFIHQPDRVAPKASDVSAADLLYQYTWKNTRKYSLKWKTTDYLDWRQSTEAWRRAKDNMKTSADKRRRTSMMDIKVGDVVLCRLKERKTTAWSPHITRFYTWWLRRPRSVRYGCTSG